MTDQAAPNIACEHRPRAHRIDAGLRKRARRKRDDIAGGEYVVVLRDLQRLAHAEKAVAVEGEPRRREPTRGCSLCRPQDLVRHDRWMIPEQQPAGLDARHLGTGHHGDAARGENGQKARPECGRKVLQDFVRDEHE